MGTVHRALHTKLGKLVAVKLLPTHRRRDAAAILRFEREMRAVGKLEHLNIVRATDAGEFDGMHYLVMELVERQPQIQDLYRTTDSLNPADIDGFHVGILVVDLDPVAAVPEPANMILWSTLGLMGSVCGLRKRFGKRAA
jgi:serine/threonine protein kinase